MRPSVLKRQIDVLDKSQMVQDTYLLVADEGTGRV
jgi:hypothetical protein